MSYRNKCISSLLFLLLYFAPLGAQYSGQRAAVTLNSYAEFANLVVSRAGTWRHTFNQANRLLNDYYMGTILDITYLAQDDQNLDDIKLAYQNAKADGEEHLMEAYRLPLGQKALEIVQTLEELKSLKDQLEEFMRAKYFKTDQVYGIDQLHKVEKLERTLKLQRNALNELILKTHKDYRLHLVDRELNNVYGMLDAWHRTSDNLIENANSHNIEDSKHKLKLLKDIQQKLRDISTGKNGLFLKKDTEKYHPVIDSILIASDEFIYQADMYFKSFTGSKSFSECGRPYRSTNDNYYGKSNKAQLEITRQSNEFIILTKEEYVNFVGEPALFEVLDPRRHASPVNVPSLYVTVPRIVPEASIVPPIAKIEREAPKTPKAEENNKVVSKNPFDYAAPNNVVLLLDVSGSMQSPEKLPMMRKTLQLLLPKMDGEDRISVVAYSDHAKVVLPPTPATNIDEILNALEETGTGTYTNINDGIKTAYIEAHDMFQEGANNQVILATDGQFPVEEATLRLIGKKASVRNISLSVFYFDRVEQLSIKDKMKKITTAGNGGYYFIQKDNMMPTLLERLTAVKQGVE